MSCTRVPGALLDHFVEFVFGWKILRFAFGRASLRPTCDQFELFGSQCLIVAEITETFHPAPRRHPAFQDFLFNGSPPRECFAIFDQRESGSAFPMACDTARIENARNFPIPGNGSCDDVVSR